MMSLVEFFSQPVWHRLGLTLVHFLWQGMAVAVIACTAVRVLQLKRGNPRYTAYLLAFAVMAVCPPITFMALRAPAKPAAIAAGAGPQIAWGGPVPRSLLLESGQGPKEDPVTPAPLPHVPLREKLDGVLQISLPWVLICWMSGVFILSVRLLLGSIGIHRWRRNLEPLTDELSARIRVLSERLGMPGFSRVFVSRQTMEAVAMGYLRPMVLLPAALVTRMPPEMLEAIIAHELAHIRRFDLWVNLAQRVVETLLFYHPAVWWLSSRLRSERELCCDELAVQATGERLTYASTLESVGRARLAARQPALAVGLGQGKKPTLGRVRHVLGLPPTPPDSRYWLAGVIAVALLAILAVPTASVLTARAEMQLTSESSDEAAASSGESGQPRFAARTFNSNMAFDVFVEETPRSILAQEGRGSDFEARWIGRTPSATPLEIPACRMWLVSPSAPVNDWDLLVREISQKKIPGLMLSEATDSDVEHLVGLTRLQHLDLRYTQITDAGLVYLKGLTELRELGLRRTQITGAGLKHLKGLTGLEELYLADNPITDAGLEHLKDLTELRRVDLSQTQITDVGLAHLRGLIGLQVLDLGYNWVTDRGLAHLEGMTQLQELALWGSAVAETRLEHLKGLTGLQVLDLSLTHATDADLAYLEDLTELRQLDLSDTWITDAGLAHLKGLTGLQHLYLRDNPITDAGLEHLKGLTELRQLDLSQTEITDVGLENLKDLTGLQQLDLSRTGITGTGLAHLQDMTKLQNLSLGTTQITGPGLEHLKALSELEQLDLSGSKITGAGLAHLEGLAKLQKLSLGETQITGPGLEHLKSFTALRELSLRETQITDTGLAYMEGVISLQFLNLSNTQITDAGLAHLRGLTELRGLGLTSGRITDQGLEHLKNLPKLKQVNFDGHPGAWPISKP